MKKTISTIILAAAMLPAYANFQPLKFGNFDTWSSRTINESRLVGGAQKTIYSIGPSSGSPWASSNVVAKVMGITKGSNAVFPDTHAGGKCVKMTTLLEHCKAAGLVNMDVLVAGSIFLGKMNQPISSTKNPYSKMEMGVPYTGRPKALRFDYKLEVPSGAQRIYSSGFGKQKVLGGRENADVFIFLQRRWEDAKGNIHAKRVGTGRQRFGSSTAGWVNAYQIPILYGDITGKPGYKSYMGLIPRSHSYYARNSKGKMVPVIEEGWDAPGATPTHMLVMASSASGDAYTGTPGMTLWLDNIGLIN